MNYVTVAMLAEHARKEPKTVRKALKLAQVKSEKCPGIKGIRISEHVANNFLRKQWPEVGPLPSLS